MSHVTLIIDASSYLYAHYSGTGGQHHSGKAIRKLAHAHSRQFNSDVIAVFDPPDGRTWRHAIFPSYKADRKPKPDGLVDALAEAWSLAHEDGILGPEFANHEADDVVAHCVQRVLDAGGQAAILSRDKDMYQLLESGRCCIIKEAKSLGNGVYDWVYYNARAFRDEYGLIPSQWPDYRAIMGDTSDNWKGASGLGEVAAKKVLQHAGTLRQAMQVRDNLPITNKQRMALSSFEWELGLELMTLRRYITGEAMA